MTAGAGERGVGKGWRGDAACATSDPELFFPIGTGEQVDRQVEEAKSVCAGCSVRDDCLTAAVTQRIAEGIFGGRTPAERSGLTPTGPTPTPAADLEQPIALRPRGNRGTRGRTPAAVEVEYRTWKAQVLADAERGARAGRSYSDTARRHGISPDQLHAWRRREGLTQPRPTVDPTDPPIRSDRRRHEPERQVQS